MKLRNEPNRKPSVDGGTGDLFQAIPANPHTVAYRGRPFADANQFSRALMWYAAQGVRVCAVDVCFHPAGYWFELEYPA